jgi:hypothetical protein
MVTLLLAATALVASNANIIRDNDIDLDNPDVAGDQRTGAHGINVSGNDNQILGNHVQRVGGNGVNITGTRNRVDSGSACLIENNAGHGVAISSSVTTSCSTARSATTWAMVSTSRRPTTSSKGTRSPETLVMALS